MLNIFNQSHLIWTSYHWMSSSILSLHNFSSGPYNLSWLGCLSLLIPGHQIWPFGFLHKKGRVGGCWVSFNWRIKKKGYILKNVPPAESEKAWRMLPDTSADASVQSNGGPSPLVARSADTANTRIGVRVWARLVDQPRKLPPHSLDLKYIGRKKILRSNSFKYYFSWHSLRNSNIVVTNDGLIQRHVFQIMYNVFKLRHISFSDENSYRIQRTMLKRLLKSKTWHMVI